MTTPPQRSLDRALAVLGAALVLASGVVLVVYGAEGEGGAKAPVAAATSVDEVPIADFKYVPAAISVATGTTITWTNRDSAPHTATSGASPSPDGLFDTGILKKGQSKKIKLSKPGTFEYYCELHAFMKGTVTVR